jgi:hypothetical protein
MRSTFLPHSWTQTLLFQPVNGGFLRSAKPHEPSFPQKKWRRKVAPSAAIRSVCKLFVLDLKRVLLIESPGYPTLTEPLSERIG